MIFLSSKTLTRLRRLLWKDQGVNSQYLWWWWSYSCQTLLATGLWWDCELFWSRLVRLSLICFENCVFWHLFSRSGWQLRHDYNTWGERIAGPRGGYVAASQVVPRHWPGGGSRSQNTTNILNTSTVWISNVSVSADHVCLVRCQKKWSGGWNERDTWATVALRWHHFAPLVGLAWSVEPVWGKKNILKTWTDQRLTEAVTKFNNNNILETLARHRMQRRGNRFCRWCWINCVHLIEYMSFCIEHLVLSLIMIIYYLISIVFSVRHIFFSSPGLLPSE